MSEKPDLALAPQGVPVVDPQDIPVVFVDWFIHGHVHEGVFSVTLGTIDHSRKKPGEEFAHVVVASKLRMSAEFAGRLHDVLGAALGRGALPGAPKPN